VQFRKQVEAGSPRHSEVTHNEIKRSTMDGTERVINAGGAFDKVAFAFERHLDTVAASAVIIRDQNGFHGVCPPCDVVSIWYSAVLQIREVAENKSFQWQGKLAEEFSHDEASHIRWQKLASVS